MFGPDGFITEQAWFGWNASSTFEMDHWWYDKGTPVRRVSNKITYVKRGEQWVQE
jgi:hypothetical protein